MVNPMIMCRKHLLGEHVEHHMFAGTVNKEISVAGYLADNLLEPKSLFSRHAELVAEMTARGYNHNSEMPPIPLLGHLPDKKINRESALAELLRRCPECRARCEMIYPRLSEDT